MARKSPHVLGYVGKINTEIAPGLESAAICGKTMRLPKTLVSKALKNFMNPYCMAKPGHLEEEVNNRGRAIRT